MGYFCVSDSISKVVEGTTCTCNNSKLFNGKSPFSIFSVERKEKKKFLIWIKGVSILLLLFSFSFSFFFMRLDLKQCLEEFRWRAFGKSCPLYFTNLESWDSMSVRHKRRNFMVWFLEAFAYCNLFFCFICLFVVYEEVWMLDFFNVSKLCEGFENVMFLLVLEVLVSLVGG